MASPDKAKVNATIGAPAMAAAMMAVNPVATIAWHDIMSESVRFLTTRLQHDLATQQAMLACKSPTDVLQVQTEFFKSAMEQYSAFANHFYSKVSTTADATVSDARANRARGFDDVPI